MLINKVEWRIRTRVSNEHVSLWPWHLPSRALRPLPWPRRCPAAAGAGGGGLQAGGLAGVGNVPALAWAPGVRPADEANPGSRGQRPAALSDTQATAG